MSKERDTPRESQLETTPARLPETTPPVYPGPDYSFTLQAIMEMQKTLGQTTQALATLTEQIKKHDDKIGDIGHKIHTAEVLIGVWGAIISVVGIGLLFLLKNIWDFIHPLIKVTFSH